MKPIAELRRTGSKLGREGMSLLAQEFLADYDGSYKGIIELAGKLSLIVKMTTCDEYWNEQAERGIHKAEIRIEAEAD
jgi:hypothetical protein